MITGIRPVVESWRTRPESQWQVTPATARLLRRWRTHPFANQRPFFCQIEGVETVIWLTEAAGRSSAQRRRFCTHLEAANAASYPELMSIQSRAHEHGAQARDRRRQAPGARLMQAVGLAGVIRGQPVRTTISDQSAPCPLDRVNRQLRTPASGMLWVSDLPVSPLGPGSSTSLS